MTLRESGARKRGAKAGRESEVRAATCQRGASRDKPREFVSLTQRPGNSPRQPLPLDQVNDDTPRATSRSAVF
jgi:hypothetical protein